MIFDGFSAFIETLLIVRAKSIAPISVSFAPSSSPDWSVSVTVEDLRPPDSARTRNDGRRFREEGR